jgi:hypothetical protein
VKDVVERIRRGESLEESDVATVDPHWRSKHGETLLHVAVVSRNLDAVGDLLRFRVDPNVADISGNTALHYAANGRDVVAASLVELLLAHGADPNLVDDYGNTALWRAVFAARGQYLVVERLLSQACGTSVRTRNKAGRSPLDFATQIGDTALVKMLAGV